MTVIANLHRPRLTTIAVLSTTGTLFAAIKLSNGISSGTFTSFNTGRGSLTVLERHATRLGLENHYWVVLLAIALIVSFAVSVLLWRILLKRLQPLTILDDQLLFWGKPRYRLIEFSEFFISGQGIKAKVKGVLKSGRDVDLTAAVLTDTVPDEIVRRLETAAEKCRSGS
jgi:hypothetical protein